MSRILFFLFIGTLLSAYEPIAPIPLHEQTNMPKAKLGQLLFFDTSLSKDGTISCFSCHNIYEGGADERRLSLGVGGKEGDIHSPSVFNARYNFKQFWNGRAANLHEQAEGPLNNPFEHAMDKESIEKVLNASPSYRKMFQTLYGTNRVRYEDAIDAIVAFEETLTTPNAKFDRYLRGEISLSEAEKQGYMLFKQYGCITCHNGINVGGNSFQKMGTFTPYKSLQTYPDRKAITGKKEHANVFKVPTLRNIALSAPYFHDASAPTLRDAVKLMAHYNLGVKIPDEDIDAIVLFLNTLTGEKPEITEPR